MWHILSIRQGLLKSILVNCKSTTSTSLAETVMTDAVNLISETMTLVSAGSQSICA